jgi:hypothetical protein
MRGDADSLKGGRRAHRGHVDRNQFPHADPGIESSGENVRTPPLI